MCCTRTPGLPQPPTCWAPRVQPFSRDRPQALCAAETVRTPGAGSEELGGLSPCWDRAPRVVSPPLTSEHPSPGLVGPRTKQTA